MRDEPTLWYAGYGSNLLAARFRAYLAGGPAPGSDWRERGCADSSPPREERARLLPGRLRFAGHSKRWGGAAAFFEHDASVATGCMGRCYRITRGQFVDVLRQENQNVELDCDIDALVAEGSQLCGDGAYALALCCGELDGLPVLSFTAAEQRPPAAPSKAYLRCIIAGLRETYHLNKRGVRRYLLDAPGIAGAMDGPFINKLFDDCEELLA